MLCAVVLLSLFVDSWAVSSQIDARGTLIRRESTGKEESQSWTLTPTGGTERDEFVQEERSATYPKNLGYKAPEETCNDDFLLGVEDSNSCLDTVYHKKILDEGMCMKAAELWGRRVEHNFFVIHSDYYDVHPQGCFQWPCTQTQDRGAHEPANDTLCFYYNPNGDDTSATAKGYPVCYRAEYLNGTVDNVTGEHECDPNFQNVMDEQACYFAAECLGYATEPEFRVGEWNWSKHDEYPKGCFIRLDTGAFQFNNISSLGGQDPKHPTLGGGIPVCNVSTPDGRNDAVRVTSEIAREHGFPHPSALLTPAPAADAATTTADTAAADTPAVSTTTPAPAPF